MLAERIPEIQSAVAEAGADGWFFACFQRNDPIGLDLLGLSDETKLVTRRCYYVIPREGEPRKLVHGLEPAMLDHLPGSKAVYTTWAKHREELAKLVSAADLAQRFAATWSAEQLETHRRANTHLHRIALEAFARVSEALRKGDGIDEYTVQRFILDAFDQAGLWTESDPIIGVNAHSADPHYQPGPDRSSPIQKGDFLLIDLWAKEKAAGSIYGDITWVGVCAAAPTDKQQEVYDVVTGARDAAWELVKSRFPRQPVHGFEVDDAAREVIQKAGYGEFFIHRTGHSIGTSDHGQGANMDNLETHDTRLLLPMTGFSIEPGIYLPGDFGVRSEINVALTSEAPEITGGEPQRELLRLLA